MLTIDQLKQKTEQKLSMIPRNKNGKVIQDYESEYEYLTYVHFLLMDCINFRDRLDESVTNID